MGKLLIDRLSEQTNKNHLSKYRVFNNGPVDLEPGDIAVITGVSQGGTFLEVKGAQAVASPDILADGRFLVMDQKLQAGYSRPGRACDWRLVQEDTSSQAVGDPTFLSETNKGKRTFTTPTTTTIKVGYVVEVGTEGWTLVDVSRVY